MSGILNWRKCKKCGEMFDVGSNFPICPDCRIDVVEDELEVNWE